MFRYSDELRARVTYSVCVPLTNGVGLRGVAQQPGFPCASTIRLWAKSDPALAEQIRNGRSGWRLRTPYRYYEHQAEAFLRRIRGGETILELLRDPSMPRRKAFTAWKKRDPEFRARLEAAVAYAWRQRRRGPDRKPRRNEMTPTEKNVDALVLALMNGATLPEVYATPGLPGWRALKRWRKDDPELRAVLKGAQRIGRFARLRAKDDARCTPELTSRVEYDIIHGGCLATFAKTPGAPSMAKLYRWVQERPEFAAAVAKASEFRNLELYGPQLEDPAIRKRLAQQSPYPGERRAAAARAAAKRSGP